MEVVILAGGLGTRLRGVLSSIPKCMAPVAGRPFLGWMLDWIMQYPVDHVVFSVGYLKEQIIDFVKAGSWPFRYDFAMEETPLGTGGGIALALGLCEGNEVVVVNGDTFFPADLSALTFDAPVTLALKRLRHFDRYGAVECSGGLITAFHEKAPCEDGLINGGVYAIDRSRLDLSPLQAPFSFEKEVLEPGAALRMIAGRECGAYFIDIGIPEDLARSQWEIPAWFAVRRASEAVLASDARTLFLDRDGVLNRLRPGDYVKNWAEWEWMPGVLDEMPRWARKFAHIVLVSNQRGVGKGLMSDADLSRIHARMMTEILDAGGRLDLVLTCTATDDGDPRRKPNPGMFREACSLIPAIEGGKSIMIGDTPSDAAFAKNCGMQFVLLAS